ncbi:serine hydrolase domain-containing protein [Metabacillus sp. 113a]|uniref:serine hydrolase domain-containing protein n=1 Tax=Metabacillus sp. 113a TaxID=3404706 RepID=UPI003CF67587
MEVHNQQSKTQLNATGLSCMVLQENKVVYESYSGIHDYGHHSRPVQPDSRFNIASIRKAYIGFALAWALSKGKIKHIDQELGGFFPDLQAVKGTSIRNLVTHTHGLAEKDSRIVRTFLPGESWSYNNTGVDLLVKLIRLTTGKTIAQILHDEVFSVTGTKESGWIAEEGDRDVSNPMKNTQHSVTDGSQSNLYCSTRNLAWWGNLFLNEGNAQGKQILTPALFKQMTAVQSPEILPAGFARQGFFWWVKEKDFPDHELGSNTPAGSYQLLGISGCICLVMPKYNAVAVRMLNQSGQSPEFDYLADVRVFGDLAAGMVE